MKPTAMQFRVKRSAKQHAHRITCLLLGHTWQHFAFALPPQGRWQLSVRGDICTRCGAHRHTAATKRAVD